VSHGTSDREEKTVGITKDITTVEKKKIKEEKSHLCLPRSPELGQAEPPSHPHPPSPDTLTWKKFPPEKNKRELSLTKWRLITRELPKI
jgi:hypothetical protein